MAEEIASLIVAHNLYLATTRVLRNDIVKACNSIGYPTNDDFIEHMDDFKLHDQFIYYEMQNITTSFDFLTGKAEQLAQDSRNLMVAAGGVVQPLEMNQIQERVKQEVDRVLEKMTAKAEARADELRARNTGVAAARDAAEPNTAGSSTETLMEGNNGMAPPRGTG